MAQDLRNELFRDSRVMTYLETLDIDVQQSDAWAKNSKTISTMMIWDIHIDIQVHDAWRKVWRDPLVLHGDVGLSLNLVD